MLWANVISIADLRSFAGQWPQINQYSDSLSQDNLSGTYPALSGDGNTLIIHDRYADASTVCGSLEVMRRSGLSWQSDKTQIEDQCITALYDVSQDGNAIAYEVANSLVVVAEYDAEGWIQVFSFTPPPGTQGLNALINHDASVFVCTYFSFAPFTSQAEVYDLSGNQPVRRGDIIPLGPLSFVDSLDGAGDTLAVTNNALFSSLFFGPGYPNFEIHELENGTQWRQVFSAGRNLQPADVSWGTTELSQDGTTLVHSQRFSYEIYPGNYTAPGAYEDPVRDSGIIERYEDDADPYGWGPVGEPLIGNAGDELMAVRPGALALRSLSPDGATLVVGSNRVRAESASIYRSQQAASIFAFGKLIELPSELVTTLEGKLLNSRSSATVSPDQDFVQALQWTGSSWEKVGQPVGEFETIDCPDVDLGTSGIPVRFAQLSDSSELMLVSRGCSGSPELNSTIDSGLYAYTTLADKLALDALYATTDGLNWDADTGWLTDDSPCYRYGVLCDKDGFVSALWLSDNNLVGVLPESLGLLRFLKSFDIERNILGGAMPQSLGQLVNLQQLFAGNSGLGGALDLAITALKDLSYLDLSNNEFSGDAAMFSQLHELRRLNLSNNQFSGNFPSGKSWPRVEIINLSGNSMSGVLPNDIYAMPRLKNLNLSGNSFSEELPTTLDFLDDLLSINLSNNSFSGVIGPSLGSFFTELQFNLAGNRFTCPYPSSLESYFAEIGEDCKEPAPPSAPVITGFESGDGEISLWVLVSDDGGAEVLSYEGVCSDGINEWRGVGKSSRIIVSGLTNGIAHTCAVTVTNSVGTSLSSVTSQPITPEEVIVGLPVWLLYQATQ